MNYRFDWQIKEYLKVHLRNQQGYQKRLKRRAGKGRATSMDQIGLDNLSDFGSGVEENGNESVKEF